MGLRELGIVGGALDAWAGHAAGTSASCRFWKYGCGVLFRLTLTTHASLRLDAVVEEVSCLAPGGVADACDARDASSDFCISVCKAEK